MAKVKVIGMDPSLSNWGLAGAVLDTDTGAIDVRSIAVVKPVFNNHKSVRQNSKDLDRAEYLAMHVGKLVKEAQAIFVEVPHGSQSARAMASYGICVGILASLRANGTQFYELTANEVKLASAGSKTASKQDMIDWAMKAQPDTNWPLQKGRVVASKAEHMADAIGAIYAGVQLPQFKSALQLAA